MLGVAIASNFLTNLLPINPLAPVTKIVVLGFSVSDLIFLYGDLFFPFSSDLSHSVLFDNSFDVSKALVILNFFIYWLLDLLPHSHSFDDFGTDYILSRESDTAILPAINPNIAPYIRWNSNDPPIITGYNPVK